MHCPRCFEEYQPDVQTCPDCGVALAPGSPEVSAASLDSRRIRRRNAGLVLISVGVLSAVGGESVGRWLGLGVDMRTLLTTVVAAACVAAGLWFYSGTKRPIRRGDGTTSDSDGAWERL